MATLDEFTRAYIEAALWSSSDTRPGEEEPRPLDDGLSVDDFAQETLDAMIADCAKFQADNATDISTGSVRGSNGDYSDVERAGHDFWLTRAGHGCGFWDGDWPHECVRSVRGTRSLHRRRWEDLRLAQQ